MNSSYNQIALSVLIFSPLVAAALTVLIRRENLLRLWTLAFTSAAALFSLPLYFRFDVSTAEFQFRQTLAWIPSLKIQYAVGVDGISLLLVLLTTLVMPLCVLASWRYIQTRVREFMMCLLIMETAMIGVFCALDLVLFFCFWDLIIARLCIISGSDVSRNRLLLRRRIGATAFNLYF